jgi:mevalonate kinase
MGFVCAGSFLPDVIFLSPLKKMTTSSAPGKIILFGEHAVVYGHPAIAIPVNEVSATVIVETSQVPGIWIEAPGIGLSAEISTLESTHPLSAAITITLDAINAPPPLALRIKIVSTIPVAAGLGSGAAVSIALIRAISSHFCISLPDKNVSALAFQIEKIHHGTPSGIDNTTITFGKPLFFIKGKAMELLKVGKTLTFIIGDTGVSSPTRKAVMDVRSLREKEKNLVDSLFHEIEILTLDAKDEIKNGNPAALGELMNKNHSLLQQLSVSGKELDLLVQAANKAGALGAKMSGGGRGGNMIALVRKENAPGVSEALKSAGAKNTIFTRVDQS